MTTDPFVVPLERLRSRTSAKWQHFDPDVLPLWVAEMDVDLAPPIREALERAIRDSDTGYPGSTPYIEAFVGFAQERWDWEGLDQGRVVPVQSVILGYVDALLEHTDAGGHVIVNPPVYPPFYSYLIQADRAITEAPLSADLRLDFAAIEEAMREARADGRRAAYLLCNPHNPGGTVHTRAELERLAALSQQYGVPVVSDEIHAPIMFEGHEFTPYVTVDPDAVALHAASKAFNLASMPAALLVGGTTSPVPEAFRAGKHHWPGQMGAIAQAAAYAHGGEWLDGMMAGLERNRLLVRDLIAQRLPGVGYTVPEATYLTWLNFGDILGEDPATVLLERGRVALNRGLDFGTGGAGHARLNIATSPEILTMAVERMAAAVERAGS